MSDWDDGYAKGRADEREHTAFLHEALLRNQLADLRAQVQALPTVGGVTMPYVKGAEHQYEMVYRADVLAVIDGSGKPDSTKGVGSGKALADLRAKVEELPIWEDSQGWLVMSYKDVVALLGRGSDD